MRWSPVVAIAAVGWLIVTATGAAATPVAVAMHGYRFHAAAVEVAVGEAVTWTNEDTARHDVSTVSGPESFASGLLERGASFTWTPSLPGEFLYVCTIHDEMAGTLTVVAAPSPAAGVVTPTGVATPTTVVPTTALAVGPRSVITTRPLTSTTRSPSLLWPVAATAVAVWAAVVLVGGTRRRPT